MTYMEKAKPKNRISWTGSLKMSRFADSNFKKIRNDLQRRDPLIGYSKGQGSKEN